MNRSVAVCALSLLWLSACSKNIRTKEAVLQGVTNHLSKRTDLSISTMKVEISSVKFEGDQAEAMVAFSPKGMEGSGGMQMRYTLEKKGNEWVVKTKADSGAQGHGAVTPAPQSSMPPDHPPIGGGSGLKK